MTDTKFNGRAALNTGEKAQEEFEARRQMQLEDEARILAATERERKRQEAEGEPNWALYNYLLHTVNYTNISSYRDAMFTFYRRLWPFILSMENDIRDLKQLVLNLSDEETTEKYNLKEVLEKPTPSKMAEDVLNKFKEAAKGRAKKGVYTLPKNKIEV